MFFFKKNLFIVLIFFAYSSVVFAENKMVFLDLEYLVNNSNIGKKVLNDLNQISIEENKKLKIKENSIKDEEIKINNTKNILSKKEFETKVNLLKDKISKYNIEKDNIKIEFIKKKNIALNDLFKKVNPLVSEYMGENSITIIIDKKNVYLGKKEYDVTEEILKLINENLK